MNKAPVVVFMAGGTGGHIFPALATAKELQGKGFDIHWLGTPGSMEADLVPKPWYRYQLYSCDRTCEERGSPSLLKAPWKLAASSVMEGR